MGATNSVQILQGDISFIIQDEMPDIAAAFMDNVNVKGPPTCYETDSSGWYVSTPFVDLPHSHLWCLAPSAQKINIWRSFWRIQESVSLFGSISTM